MNITHTPIKFLCFAFAAMVMLIAVPSHAQTTLTGILSSDISIGNDGRYRGLSQTVQQPFVRANIEYGFPVGLYLGTQWNNVSERIYAGSNARVDVYGGFRGDFSPFNLEMGTRYHAYTNSDGSYLSRNNESNAVNLHEIFLGMTWQFVTVKANYSLSKFYGLSNSSGSSYLEVNADPVIAPNVNLIAHAGYQKVKGNSDANYSDYALGINMQLNKTYSLSISGVGSNAKDKFYQVNKTSGGRTNIGKSGLVLALSAKF